MSDAFSERLLSVLSSLESWLGSERIDRATIGGVAVSLIAQPRFTNDIDAVIWVESGRWQSLVDSGAHHGFVPRIQDPVRFAQRSRVLLMKHAGTEIGIDLSCGVLPFEREVIDNAVAIEVGGLQFRVARPEDLIIMKAVAQRPKDLADIESILNVHQNLDIPRIRRWVDEFAAALESPELSENLERILAKH